MKPREARRALRRDIRERHNRARVHPAVPAGPTYGPWCEHGSRCRCNVCR